MRSLLKDALEQRDFKESKAAKTIRDDIFGYHEVKFDVHSGFPSQCQEMSVAASLILLIGMMLNGTDIHNDDNDTQACLTVAQTIVFNAKKRQSDESKHSRHNLLKEPPLYTWV